MLKRAAIPTDSSLERAHLKITRARLTILDIVREAQGRHLSAEDIFRQLLDAGHDAALATVYRVLSSLEAAGLVSRRVFDGGRAVYELNTGEHHDHLICLGWGRVDEFRDGAIEARQEALASANGSSWSTTAFCCTDTVRRVWLRRPPWMNRCALRVLIDDEKPGSAA